MVNRTQNFCAKPNRTELSQFWSSAEPNCSTQILPNCSANRTDFLSKGLKKMQSRRVRHQLCRRIEPNCSVRSNSCLKVRPNRTIGSQLFLQGVRLRVCKTSLDLNPSILVRFLHNMAHFKGKAWHFDILSRKFRSFIFCMKIFVGFESRGFSSCDSIKLSPISSEVHQELKMSSNFF